MAKLNVKFEFERATKRTYRFKEVVVKDGETPVVGSLYIAQTVFGTDGEPKHPVSVVIEGKDLK